MRPALLVRVRLRRLRLTLFLRLRLRPALLVRIRLRCLRLTLRLHRMLCLSLILYLFATGRRRNLCLRFALRPGLSFFRGKRPGLSVLLRLHNVPGIRSNLLRAVPTLPGKLERHRLRLRLRQHLRIGYRLCGFRPLLRIRLNLRLRNHFHVRNHKRIRLSFRFLL